MSLVMAPKGLGPWGLGLGAWGPPSRRGASAWQASGLGRSAFTLVVLAAVLPDIDFAWGGHNRETHSLGAAILAGAAVLAWTRGRNPKLALAVILAWSTHVLFDWLGSDDTPPLGVMALWPLTNSFYFADAFVFEAISRRYWLSNFVSHNLFAVGKEIAMLAPVAAALLWLRKRLES